MRAEQTQTYRGTIMECFALDEDLLSIWHLKSGCGLEECVQTTFRDMLNADVEFFEVKNNETLVGYFGREAAHGKQFLTGFFVKPEFRTSNVMKDFWDLIRSQFNDPFYCGLYAKNEPAIKFIMKNNGEQICDVVSHGERGQLFKITKDESCQ